MNLIEKVFYNALKHAITGEPLTKEFFTNLSEEDWNALYQLSRQQGVLAIVFDSLEGISAYIPSQIKLKWAYGAMQIENRFDKQLSLANEIGGEFCKHNIKTVVLKGFAISQYYHIPRHRECGDFDCYLMGEFERGNIIASKLGAKVRFDDYKHSHINYKGLTIENHKFCTSIRGAKVNKDFETFLQQLLIDEQYGISQLNDYPIYTPSPTFNALFLLKHSMLHFLYEGIKIRHLLDWAYFINNENDNINWEICEYWCSKLNLNNFTLLLNKTIERYIGLQLPLCPLKGSINDKNIDRFIDNILYSDSSVYNRKHNSIWGQRYAIVKNIILNRWKFSQVYNKSLTIELMRASVSAIVERHPKL